jgi:hypothetical protein
MPIYDARYTIKEKNGDMAIDLKKLNVTEDEVKEAIVQELTKKFEARMREELKVVTFTTASAPKPSLYQMFEMAHKKTEELFIKGEEQTKLMRCHSFQMEEENVARLSYRILNSLYETWVAKIKYHEVGEHVFRFDIYDVNYLDQPCHKLESISINMKAEHPQPVNLLAQAIYQC